MANIYKIKEFTEDMKIWMKNGNVVHQQYDVYFEQSTQFRTPFTKQELIDFYVFEFMISELSGEEVEELTKKGEIIDKIIELRGEGSNSELTDLLKKDIHVLEIQLLDLFHEQQQEDDEFDSMEFIHLFPSLTPIVESSNEDADPYKENERLLKEFQNLGFTFEYGLDGEPYNLSKFQKKRIFEEFVNSKKEMSIKEYNRIGICEAKQGTVLVYEDKFHIEKNGDVFLLSLERSDFKGTLLELEKLLFEFVEDEFPLN